MLKACLSTFPNTSFSAGCPVLELIYVRTRIAELKRMIIDAIEKSKTIAAGELYIPSLLCGAAHVYSFYFIYLIFFFNSDARKQWNQKIDLLRKLIIQLKDDENNRELSK